MSNDEFSILGTLPGLTETENTATLDLLPKKN